MKMYEKRKFNEIVRVYVKLFIILDVLWFKKNKKIPPEQHQKKESCLSLTSKLFISHPLIMIFDLLWIMLDLFLGWLKFTTMGGSS